MGTNYYWHANVCSQCGRGDKPKHIGKSSAGWCFSLRVYPHENIHDLDDWERILTAPEGQIRDEYGEKVSAVEMHRIITERGRDEAVWERKPAMYESWGEFHRLNHSQQGPRGLLRHVVDGVHTIKNGRGTWDCCQGEFS